MEQKTKQADEKFCPECGEIIKSKAEICPKCGVRQTQAYSASNDLSGSAPNGKSKVAAALFAFFLGGFGAHKFYLGQTAQGIFYLLLFWTFIPSIVAFIEGILLLTMKDEVFNIKYGGSTVVK
jgi:TM2 domain-containing membrane protein YozV/ribosomal protein S27AE